MRIIETGVPFLLINPDARLGGMGDAGVALMDDHNALASNPSKIANIQYANGFSISYSPRMRSLADNISLLFANGVHYLSKTSAIGGSVRYISLGEFELVDSEGRPLGIFAPNEMAVDLTYAKRFGESFSLGTTMRYIYSGLEKANINGNGQAGPANAFAVDVSASQINKTMLLGKDAIVSFGANLSNIGTKIGNGSSSSKDFLPTMIKIGTAVKSIMDDYNQFTVALDFSKLLVPSSPIYDLNDEIISGTDPDKSVPAAIFRSFSDAPGGASEEFKEVNVAVGIEYEYSEKFALRSGYFYQNPLKGFNRYVTAGIGLKYNHLSIDVAYVIGRPQSNLLANTLRFSLFYGFN